MDVNSAINFSGVIISFILGFFAGFITREAIRKFEKGADFYRNLVLLAVVTVWCISVLVDILYASYETPLALHGLMGAIVGYFYKRNEDQ